METVIAVGNLPEGREGADEGEAGRDRRKLRERDVRHDQQRRANTRMTERDAKKQGKGGDGQEGTSQKKEVKRRRARGRKVQAHFEDPREDIRENRKGWRYHG